MTSELSIESQFIHILSEQENQWRFRPDLKTEADLWINFRMHLNRLNTAVLEGLMLTDLEFERVRVEFLRLTSSPFLASQWLRGENGVAQILLERESGDKISLEAFRNKDIAGGTSAYEVVHQIVPDTERSTRGDVTLLINGLPIIHIELKKESAKDGYMQAYHQIQRYAQDGFLNGIYATTQLFVVSNKVDTRYFARPSEDTDAAYQQMTKFLFNWRTIDNVPVPDLFDFARTVLRIPDAHELISQFTILVDDQKSQKFLMVLRPYQIHAIRRIRQQAALHEGGFIWHATGSGKTITSFVATKLLAQNSVGVDRTIMVVDRTDLDSQTKNEFTKFASEYQTGQTSGDSINNTLIVGIENQHQLAQGLLSKKNNNTIIITTIQKLSAAMRSAQAESDKDGHNKFDQLRKEHIVFIVDEAHRAVSDEEMRKIKRFLPNSTWFGLTGTPIFEENQKQENGTYARTTEQQYGPLLHAYTTKNAMDDEAVLGFQVEYHSLLPEGDQEAIVARVNHGHVPEEVIEQEKLLPNEIYETPQHIEAMLHKIFDRRSVVKKFKVKNGFPTMAGILTTSSIAQAKRIYNTLQELKAAGTLLTGRQFDERHKLVDPDFPRVAITFSTNPEQQDQNQTDDELLKIMADYAKQFNSTPYTDEKLYNQNINNRLARKEKQYQSDGQWLDLVIVVDRLLTGFDSPTIQTLYVDREMKYQKLLQAFSRTNRIYLGKDAGKIVTFRKPETMKENVKATFRLFSNENQNFEALVPREYTAVRAEFDSLVNAYYAAEEALTDNPGHLPTMIEQVRAYQKLENSFKALKSYDDYEEEADTLAPIVEQLPTFQGKVENLKAKIKAEVAAGDGDDQIDVDELLADIVFSSTQNATHKENVDSFYINQLLKAIQDNKVGAIEEFDKEVQGKDPLVQPMYRDLKEHLLQSDEQVDVVALKEEAIQARIAALTEEQAAEFGLSLDFLKLAANEYQADKQVIPYLSDLLDTMTLSKADFESQTGEKYRRRTKIIEQRLRERFDVIQKWKEEL
ncbi:type I restriction endonuclease subunit R [Weissella soli]|uniref:Type I restriction enzyme endonuclease subunit n=1 Tax=Weissella soli TaxID=155866 RepID=A0A288Q960_9LACO|nr:HsdR family type I site-specific deoxyribonuclease [Weissella soli]AOT56400.1 Type I site-specific deoxyribonuclease [Weissella soli]NKY82852.1 type I restriction endonuclease subunit R [Weissella soli]RDL11969.1 type I restriction enzyme R subunit [Weissella soli]GEN92801.1 deoxyribonuclease [Weissella soli]